MPMPDPGYLLPTYDGGGFRPGHARDHGHISILSEECPVPERDDARPPGFWSGTSSNAHRHRQMKVQAPRKQYAGMRRACMWLLNACKCQLLSPE
jgi:hypothetical protein